jgi:hypothetical protein
MATAERLQCQLVTLTCLHCGATQEELVADLRAFGPLPRPCTHCGGPVLATSAEPRWVANPAARINMPPASAPKRGRPRRAA